MGLSLICSTWLDGLSENENDVSIVLIAKMPMGWTKWLEDRQTLNS